MSVADIFETMVYGPAPETDAQARAWLAAHGPALDHFIDGAFVAPASAERFTSLNPTDGTPLIEVAQGDASDVDRAVAAARRASGPWRALGGHARARYLYALARGVQRNARLLAVLESLDNGKPIRESRDIDIPLVARHFYHHAGWAQLLDAEFPRHEALGVVGAVIPWNFPLLMLAWKVAPALATGNTIVLKPAEYTSLTALAFAEIARHAGLPAGVLNIVTGDGRTGALLAAHDGVDKVAFTGSTAVGREIRRATAGKGMKLSLELGGKSPFVLCDDADVDSAVEGLVDAIWFNAGQVCSAGSRLLVHEGAAENVYTRVKARMEHLRVGDPLDKSTDIGPIVSPVQIARIDGLVKQGAAEGAAVWQPATPVPNPALYYPPTLLTNVAPASTVVQEEIFGPVLVAMTFRTTAEAVALANNTPYGLAASVWSGDVGRALAIARAIKAGTVWVNGANMFDAAAGFGGYKESGFGREGGREGLGEYLRPRADAVPSATAHTATRSNGAGASHPYAPGSTVGTDASGAASGQRRPEEDVNGHDAPTDRDDPDAYDEEGAIDEDDRTLSAAAGGLVTAAPLAPAIDRTPKLFIGGVQARPDSGYSYAVVDAHGRRMGEAAHGNRKDIRNAVEAARKAAPSWDKTTAHARAQILFYIAENLASREDELAQRIEAMTGRGDAHAHQEVADAIDLLFTYAAWADKFDGAVHSTPLRGLTVALHEPIGVIGVVCPDDAPLGGLIAFIAPAIAMGSVVVAVPSQRLPLAAADFYQVLETSDVPSGVVNIVTGDALTLATVLAAHDDVDAVWYAGDKHGEGARVVESASAGNLKRTWIVDRAPERWTAQQPHEVRAFLEASIQVKNVWVPTGD